MAKISPFLIQAVRGLLSKPLKLLCIYMPVYVRYHQFDLIHSPETFFRALSALKHAAVVEPECGQVWSLLARLYLTNHTLESFDLETSMEEVLASSKGGVQLVPANQRARTILAFIRFASNEIPAVLAEIERPWPCPRIGGVL